MPETPFSADAAGFFLPDFLYLSPGNHAHCLKLDDGYSTCSKDGRCGGALTYMTRAEALNDHASVLSSFMSRFSHCASMSREER